MAAGSRAPQPAVTLLLDLEDSGAYYVLEGCVSATSLEKFIVDFEASTLDKQQIKK